jgi:transposase
MTLKIDGRTLSRETSETIRRMVVKRVREGESPSAVMKSYGLCRTTIYPWLRAHKKGGEEALNSRPSTGRLTTLSARQQNQVRRWICGKDPRQYGFDFGLWTRQIVSKLVEEKFNCKLGLTAVGRLLAKLDITPQKPLRRAYERDPVAIAKWTKEDYPKLKARAKRLGAEIFFIDEAGVRSDAALQRTWGAKGETPIVPTSGQRQKVNAISAVNAALFGMTFIPANLMPKCSSLSSKPLWAPRKIALARPAQIRFTCPDIGSAGECGGAAGLFRSRQTS